MTPRDLKNIHTTRNSYRHTLPCVKLRTKTNTVLVIAEAEVSWSLLSGSVFVLSGGTAQPENIYFCIFMGIGQV